MQPGDDPPVAVVVVVAAAKQSLSIEGGSQMKPAVVNGNLAAGTRTSFPSTPAVADRPRLQPHSTLSGLMLFRYSRPRSSPVAQESRSPSPRSYRPTARSPLSRP